ncbi:hypothetical protein DVH26_19205 [Paenibacillus sp. H1-7]|nr:hypothetical protein DVH26_19205 [Paenibacillus sp. H1-7]
MGADHQDAQDLTQETFIKAYHKLASHDPTKSFAAWLYTIASNLLKDLRRSTRHTDWIMHPLPDFDRRQSRRDPATNGASNGASAPNQATSSQLSHSASAPLYKRFEL